MTTSQTASYCLFVGVDIAKASASVAWMTAERTLSRVVTIEQTPQGFHALQQWLLSTGHVAQSILVVMEATGSYWMNLALSLTQAGFRVSVINPAQAHHFAKALLKRAKTDAIDAQTLAHLAALLQPAVWNPPPAMFAELYQRLIERESLLGMRQQVRNQLHALTYCPTVIASVRTRMEQLIESLTKQGPRCRPQAAAPGLGLCQKQGGLRSAVCLQTTESSLIAHSLSRRGRDMARIRS